MPYQCIRCGKLYDDASPELLKGCECGCRYFFFFKERTELVEEAESMSRAEKETMIKEIEHFIGKEPEEKPVIFDLESVRVIGHSKFEIDLVSLFKRKPIIYRISEGKYIIDLASTFALLKKERSNV